MDDQEVFKLQQVSMALADVRPGHGVKICLKGTKSPDFDLHSGAIDVYGPLWGAMPAGLGTVAQLLLPLRLRALRCSDFVRGKAEVVTSLGLGVYKLSHATLLARIEDGIRNGDPLFMIEVTYKRYDPETGKPVTGVLCRIPTKCSLIKASLFPPAGHADASWVDIRADEKEAAEKDKATTETESPTKQNTKQNTKQKSKPKPKPKQRKRPPSTAEHERAASGELLRRHPSIVFAGIVPAALRRRPASALSEAYTWARWWLLAALLCAANWALYASPAAAHAAAWHHSLSPFRVTGPVFGFHNSSSGGGEALAEVLPPHPAQMSDAWDLAVIHAQVQQLQQHSQHSQHSQQQAQQKVAELLAAAGAIAGRAGPLTPAELAGVRAVIVAVENHVGIVARVRGCFTLVNTIWLCAIAGIAVSIGPSLWHLLKPLREWLLRVWRWLLDEVLVPSFDRLHRWGAFELAAYTTVWWFVASGAALDDPRAQHAEASGSGSGSGSSGVHQYQYQHQHQRDLGTGVYVSLTGLVFLLPLVYYSGAVHAPKLLKRLMAHTGRDLVWTLTLGWAALSTAPVAAAYQSPLLAWLTTGMLYSALGCCSFCRGLCFYVGFESEASMARVAATSSCVLTLYAALRASESYAVENAGGDLAPASAFAAAGGKVGGSDGSGGGGGGGGGSVAAAPVHAQWLAPFASPLTVLGSVMLYLALLIISSLYYNRSPTYRRRNGRGGWEADGGGMPSYVARNAAVAGALLAGLACGHILGLPGLANTASTFGVLWAMAKYSEVHVEAGWSGWVLLLLCSTAAYRTALYLHLHPGFVASVFSGF